MSEGERYRTLIGKRASELIPRRAGDRPAIVESHGGRVWAEAALDRGATFHFTLG